MISDPIRCGQCGGATAPHGRVDVRCTACGSFSPAGRTFTLPAVLETRLRELENRIRDLELEILRELDARPVRNPDEGEI